jgi:hypothetical protein
MKIISTIFAIAMLAFFLSIPAYAKDTKEKEGSEATQHLEEAIKHGKMGHAKDLSEHAKESLKHAKKAKELGADAHMDTAIEHLGEAIKHADMGHADEGTKHAEEALSHMHASGAGKKD